MAKILPPPPKTLAFSLESDKAAAQPLGKEDVKVGIGENVSCSR